MSDDAIAESLRAQISSRQVRVDELQAELASLTPEIRRYERALALVSGEQPERKPGPKPVGRPKGSGHKGLSADSLDTIRATVLKFADDHEEFRQVDIRGILGEKLGKSSTMALAFEALRQENTIRFARQDGNNKFYRLTRATAQAEGGAEK
jgi:hypothetical protein